MNAVDTNTLVCTDVFIRSVADGTHPCRVCYLGKLSFLEDGTVVRLAEL